MFTVEFFKILKEERIPVLYTLSREGKKYWRSTSQIILWYQQTWTQILTRPVNNKAVTDENLSQKWTLILNICRLGTTSRCPDSEPNPQPMHVFWLGIEPATFQFTGWRSNKVSYTDQGKVHNSLKQKYFKHYVGLITLIK